MVSIKREMKIMEDKWIEREVKQRVESLILNYRSSRLLSLVAFIMTICNCSILMSERLLHQLVLQMEWSILCFFFMFICRKGSLYGEGWSSRGEQRMLIMHREHLKIFYFLPNISLSRFIHICLWLPTF